MSDSPLPSDAFRLGDLVVVLSLNRIIHGERSADLEPRVMGVLEVLARTPREVVSRATLFDEVWSDTVVNDEALTRAVSALRKALSDGAPGAIETIRGTGYRLVAPIRPVVPSPRPTVLEDAVLEGKPAPPSADRNTPMVALALGAATLALAVAVWAAWPRVAPPELSEARAAPSDAIRAGEASALRLDSTSEYYVPGLSEWDVYYDSSAGRYFHFEDDRTDNGSGPRRR
ncbi:winged helix-turn-helix domain-containing protein [Rubrivirga sp.]|uniref:winged helix-turn-helix domain-containing protein n=1 Tax=Rubrivirga sp. TaxID=1885344 RepID=UPI003C74DD30